MKLKKLTALLLALIMLFSTLAFTISAQGQISYEVCVNGNDYYYETLLIKKGETLTMEIKNIRLDGILTDQAEFEWYRYDDATQTFNDLIEGATSSSLSETYAGHTAYMCVITVGNSVTTKDFYFKEDTLTATASSNKNFVYTENDFTCLVNPGFVGSEFSLTVDASSTVPNANITYEWVKMPYYSYPDSMPSFETLENTTNTLNCVLDAGGNNYHCTVSDGTTEKHLYFEVLPDTTLTMNNTVNGEVPNMYAGTYIYVVKPNEKVTVDITSASTYGDVTYTWFKQNDDYSFSRLDHTEGIIELTKDAPTDYDPYASQPFECQIEDGNQKIRYWIMLFCLDPETPLTEINKIGEDTPDVSFVTEKEDLANNLLTGEELQYMTIGMPANVELSTELKNTIDEAQQNEIISKLEGNEQIGMHLEMNLQKNIAGEAIPLTELSESVKLNVALPENLVNTDSSVTREYKVVRMHNGEAEIIDCSFNGETNSLELETDKFSLYTILYEDSSVSFAALVKTALLGINSSFDINNIGEYDTNQDGVFNICDLVNIA